MYANFLVAFVPHNLLYIFILTCVFCRISFSLLSDWSKRIHLYVSKRQSVLFLGLISITIFVAFFNPDRGTGNGNAMLEKYFAFMQYMLVDLNLRPTFTVRTVQDSFIHLPALLTECASTSTKRLFWGYVFRGNNVLRGAHKNADNKVCGSDIFNNIANRCNDIRTKSH